MRTGWVSVITEITNGTFQKIDVMIREFGVLFAFLFIGEAIVYFTGIPVPSSIIGMILLTVSLSLGIVKLRWVDRVATFLVHNLGFFFVPAGIGLMRCMGLVADEWIPIVGASIGSTAVIIAVTGWVHQIVRRFLSHRNIESGNVE